MSATKVRHPPGLTLLFLTEMWERMSFYGMRNLFVLYLVTGVSGGGFGWSQGTALRLYGVYNGLVYFTPLVGGWLADRVLGQRRSVVIGGALMVVGHMLLALPGVPMFFVALAFLIVGNGFFKANISTMVGQLYEAGDPRRDGAFTIFYMGINLGSVLASFVCGTLGEKVGFHWGFASAGVGMAIGLVLFVLRAPTVLGDVGVQPSAKKAAARGEATRLTPEERDRIVVIGTLAFIGIFFWVAFEQAGGLMNLHAHARVERHVLGWEVPATWFQSLNPFFILVLGTPISLLWTWLDVRGRAPSTPAKMALGLVLVSLGFVLMIASTRQAELTGKANLLWIVGAYFLHTSGELCVSPIGLSMVTKLAPARLGSALMGVWFFSYFVSDTSAGFVGAYSEKLGELPLYAVIVATTAAAGVILFALSRRLTRMMHGAG